MTAACEIRSQLITCFHRLKMRHQVFSALIIFYLLIPKLCAYNLDLDHPVIYESKQPGDYFGFSVALHPGGTGKDVPWIMVGAPKASNFSLNSTRKDSGLVYKCLIKQGCEALKLDYPEPTDDVFNYWEEALLGSSMDMTTERFVVCSPNLKQIVSKDDKIRMYGLCYWGVSSEVDTEVHSLSPLFNPTSFFNDKVKINDIPFPKFIWGQAGFSIALYNNSQGHYQMTMGAPCAYGWNGTTVNYKDGASISGFEKKRRSPLTAFSEEPYIQDPRMSSEMGSLGFTGYSVTMGAFFARSEVVSIAGAPATVPGGKVFAYTLDQAFKMKTVLLGSQAGEYFGASVAAGDFNGDRLDDLVVGAPFYTSHMPGSQNEGRVLTYTGSHTGKFMTDHLNHEIKGLVKNGRLGTTVACVGDLDLDGFKDFAIAAPYEGSGVVYIYYGSVNGLYKSQTIVGSEVYPKISRFGFGISRGQDVDENRFGDIAIGAYKSGHIALIRSHPVVEVQPVITILGDKLQDDSKEFKVEICVSYSGAVVPPKIRMTMDLALDPGHFRIYRKKFPQTRSRILTTFEVENQLKCFNFIFLLKSDIKNKVDPILLSGEFTLAYNSSKSTSYLVAGNNDVTGKDEFCKDCPVMKNKRIVRKAEIGFHHGCKIENHCVADLSLETQFFDPTENPIGKYVAGAHNSVLLKVILRNKGDPALNTKLSLKVPTMLISLPSSCQGSQNETIECDAGNPIKNGTDRIFDFEIDLQQSVAIQDNFVEIQLSVKTAADVVNASLLTAKPRLPLAYEADVTVYGNPQKEDYRFELDSKNKDITSKVSPALIIKMEKSGKSQLQEVALKVNIPIAFGSKKFLHISPPQIESTVYSCQPNAKILQSSLNNPISGLQDLGTNLSSSNSTAKLRRKREVNLNPEKYPLDRTLFINCTNGNWQCTQLICSSPLLYDVTPATLELQLNLDMAQLESELRQNDIIIFSVTANVEIISPKSTEQPLVHSPDVAFVSAVLLRRAPAGKIATWVIIVSIIGGILLLFILVTALLKAGFFKRHARDELQLKIQQTDNAAAVPTLSTGALEGTNHDWDDSIPLK